LAAGDDVVEAVVGAGVAGLAGVAAAVEFEFVVVLLAEQAAVASKAALRPQINTFLFI